MSRKIEFELRYNKELGVDLPVRLALLNFEAMGLVEKLDISFHENVKKERTVLRIDGGPAWHKEEGTKRILQILADTLEEYS